MTKRTKKAGKPYVEPESCRRCVHFHVCIAAQRTRKYYEELGVFLDNVPTMTGLLRAPAPFKLVPSLKLDIKAHYERIAVLCNAYMLRADDK